MGRRVSLTILFLAFALVFVFVRGTPAATTAYSENLHRRGAENAENTKNQPNGSNNVEITASADPADSGLKSLSSRPLRLSGEGSPQGIASNFEGPEVLINRCSSCKCLFESWPVVSALAVPPCIFLLLSGLKKMKRRRRSPEFMSRAARGRFEKIAKGVAGYPAAGPDECRQLLGALRSFLSDRLMARTDGFTSADFDTLLQSRGIDALVLARLARFWEVCERERFGGGTPTPLEWRALVGEALDIVRNLDTQVR